MQHRPRVSLINHTTALHAVIEVLSALWEREFSGLGQTHDVYLTGLGYNYTEIPIAAYVGSGTAAKRSESGDAPSSGSHAYKGRPLVLITAGDQHQRHQVSNALERPEWPDGPRFTTRPKRSRNRAAADEAVHEVLANMTPKEAVEHFTMHEVTIAPVNTIAISADEPAVTNYGRELFRTRRVNHAAFDAA